jgi:hypothetical protein
VMRSAADSAASSSETSTSANTLSDTRSIRRIARNGRRGLVSGRTLLSLHDRTHPCFVGYERRRREWTDRLSLRP